VTSLFRATLEPEFTRPRLRECQSCGLLQSVPALPPGISAHCGRCGMTLHQARRHPLEHSLALTIAALVLLGVLCVATLMSVETAGITLTASLFSGPEELVRRGMTALAAVVVFVTVVAPFGKLLGTLYVLVGLRMARPPRHLRRIFVLVERLTPWSMVEVFVLGVLVAYVKLGDVVKISVGTGIFALFGLTFVMAWADGALDRTAVWDALDRTIPPDALPPHGTAAGAIGCEACGLVSWPTGEHPRCPRCDSPLHPRKRDSIARTWALVLTAAALYVPANVYPVLTVMQLGAGEPSTILGGVRELIASRMYPLAALVFFASIAVPMLKLVGLSFMLIATQIGHGGWLRDRTRLYHVVRWVGRWSMIDIFMEALLGALVRFGNVITIEPGIGAVAFCGVVILTMIAAETFDPRLMWDAAARTTPALRAGASPQGG
jgi:paraquat-inducible protein A